MNNWRDGGVDIGDMRVLNGAFEDRLGHCWARGRLKQGDILVAIRHSGDCFHDYLLLEPSVGSIDGKPTLFLRPIPVPFGAYTLGEPIGALNMMELGLAMAGKEFSIPLPENMPEPRRNARIEALAPHVRLDASSPVPDFENVEGEKRVHDWRNHVGESVAAIWPLLPQDVRLAIAADAQERAAAEKWD